MSYLPGQVNGNISGLVESPPLRPEKFISLYSVPGTDHLKDIFRCRCQKLGFRNLRVLPWNKEPLFDSLNKSLTAQNRRPLFAFVDLEEAHIILFTDKSMISFQPFSFFFMKHRKNKFFVEPIPLSQSG
jgi:hypothetical protein